MGVHLDLQPGTGAQGRNALKGGERFEDAQRVGKAQAAGAGALGGGGQRAQEIQVGTRGILATDADFQPEVERHADVARQLAQQPVALLLQFVSQMLVGCWHRDVDQVRAQIGAGGDVGRVHAAPHHQPGIQAEPGNRPDRLTLLGAHGRNADLQLGHADGVQAAGDVQLFRQGKGNTGRLLTVAQGGVVDGDEAGLAHGNLLAMCLARGVPVFK